MTTLMTLNVILIVYGSLYPFDTVDHAASLQDVHWLLTHWPEKLSGGDAITNIILFIPAGLLIPSLGKARTQTAWVIFSIILAWAVQYFQFWFPGRDPQGSDAWFNTLGLFMGVVASRQIRHIATSFSSRAGVVKSVQQPLWPVAGLLMLAWLGYRWFPLVPTLDVQEIKNGFKPLLAPFHLEFAAALHDTVAWLVFFKLARLSLLPQASGLKLGLLALGITVAEPFFRHNGVSQTNVMGVLLAIGLWPWFAEGRVRLAALVALQVVSIAVSEVFPPGTGPYRSFGWVPFAGLLEGNVVHNMATLFDKTFRYGSTIFLLSRAGMGLPAASALLSVLLLGLEWYQVWLPGRTPEITDALMALMLGGALHVLLKHRPAKHHHLRECSAAGTP